MTAKKKKNEDIPEESRDEYRQRFKEILASETNKPENLLNDIFLQWLKKEELSVLKREIARFRKDRDFYKGCLEKGLIHKAGPGSRSFQNAQAMVDFLNERGKLINLEIQNRK
jgi:hypothetical protein